MIELDKITKALDGAHEALLLKLPVHYMLRIKADTGVSSDSVARDLGKIIEWLQSKQQSDTQERVK